MLNSRFATIYTIHSILSQSSHKNLQVGLYVVKLVEHAIRHFFSYLETAIEGLMIACSRRHTIQVIKATTWSLVRTLKFQCGFLGYPYIYKRWNVVNILREKQFGAYFTYSAAVNHIAEPSRTTQDLSNRSRSGYAIRCSWKPANSTVFESINSADNTVNVYGYRRSIVLKRLINQCWDKSVLNIYVLNAFFCGVSSSCICSVPSDEEKSPGKSSECVGLRPTPG